jgi:cyclopropane-fatty-acyl-phospholipid synthase
MDGVLALERGTLWDLLELLGRNQLEQGRVPGNSAIGPLRAALTRIQQSNSRRAARRHVARHYDLSHEHYRQFFDTAAVLPGHHEPRRWKAPPPEGLLERLPSRS